MNTKKVYKKPELSSEQLFEKTVLACQKYPRGGGSPRCRRPLTSRAS